MGNAIQSMLAAKTEPIASLRIIAPVERNELKFWMVPASLAFHFLLIAALIILAKPTILAPEVEQSLSVEIIAPSQYQAAVGPGSQDVGINSLDRIPQNTVARRRKNETGASPIEEEEAKKMISAARTMSGQTLLAPENRQARNALPTLSMNERRLQLCNLEAMEQVHNWREHHQPELLVAMAFSEALISEDWIHVRGGAFRSHQRWYAIEYKCRVVPDSSSVAEFQFLIGAPVPRDQWESHQLVATH